MTSFGEIMEPTSRSACEYWDELNLDILQELRWQNKHNFKNRPELLYILEGKYLHECVKSDDKLELIDAIPEVNLCLYKVKDTNKYICTIKEYDLIYSSEIVELLYQYVMTEAEVVGILTKPIQTYLSNNPLPSHSILKMITTSVSPKSLSNIKYEKLEQPNIISGISAGVMTLREHLDLPGAVIVCYTVNSEEYQIEGLHELLKELNIASNIRRPTSILDSNLYL